MFVLPFLFWLLSLGLVASFVPSAQSRLPSPVTNPLFGRSLSLNAANKGRKKKKDELTSFPFPSAPFLLEDTNAVKSSLETLLVLSDKKRQAVWKEDMKRQYPFVPAVFVDRFADSVVSSFSAIAPSELQTVVQPGGLEKVKSKLETIIKKELKKNEMYANLPLSNSEKDKLLSNLIGTSLNLLLRDAAMVLAHPNEQLQALEEQKRQITRFMTRRQLVWYQLKYHTVRSALVVTASALLLTLLYNGYKSTAVIQGVQKSAIKLWVFAKSLAMGLVQLVSGSKRKRPRRVRPRVR
ncbi:unnamed protein product [Cylindrotheca closterium]|uniref:Transmembrane protein n=1 Tax=Cylindrotheca closterium TaxID=2856 RepID=A0AAD2FT80_9STRA|nr:unnamed protein product [Cylindrotheca closterium]